MSGTPQQIGPYSVQSELGRGGMGVVYRATDTRLDRTVAVKALPEHLADDPDRLARFEREAKTLASLNHPNVAGIHGVEEHESRRYLVLELVEGDTLAERLDRSPLPIDEAVEVCAQIAAGVEAAHAAGVIHRDLKPGNIIITPDGQAKVLDFGLAKAASAQSSSSIDQTHTPTMTTPPPLSQTTPGAILGTAPYMSPEQARGRAVDHRTDIWSFGVVLYECLTGASPFLGETATDSIGAILHKDVDLDRLPPGTPPNVRRVIERCLVRDRRERMQAIGDARIELQRPAEASVEAVTRRAPAGLLAVVALAALVVGIAGALLATNPFATVAAPRPVFAAIPPADGTIFAGYGDLAGPAAISPDGARVVWSARDETGAQSLWLRDLDADAPERLRETNGALFPFWSPDSRSIGFFADGHLRRLDLTTRAVRTLAEAPGGRGGAWMSDGTILYTPSFQTPILRISADGGDAEPITTVDESRFTSHRWASPVPGTDRFIFLAVSHDPDRSEQTALFLGSISGGEPIELLATKFGAQVVGDRLLFVRENTLLSVPVDLQSGRLRGDPSSIITGVVGDRSTWHSGFSASADGAIVYHLPATGLDDGQGAQRVPGVGEVTSAMIVSSDGRPRVTFVEDLPQNSLAVSPDGLRVAISARDPGDPTTMGFDIWIFDVIGPVTNSASEEDYRILTEVPPPRRLTFDAGSEVAPVWSPDGTSIAYGRLIGNAVDNVGVGIRRLDGGSERMLLEVTGEDIQAYPTDWTRDGRWIICQRGSFITAGLGDIYAIPVDGGDPIPLVLDDGEQASGVVSNDGKWLAYGDGDISSAQVYVVPFEPGWERERAEGLPAPPRNARWRVSIAGGQLPKWGPLGKTLYYASPSDTIIAVDWRTVDGSFVHDTGRAMFDFQFETAVDFAPFPNEDLFAIHSEAAETATAELRLLLHWPSLID